MIERPPLNQSQFPSLDSDPLQSGHPAKLGTVMPPNTPKSVYTPLSSGSSPVQSKPRIVVVVVVVVW